MIQAILEAIKKDGPAAACRLTGATIPEVAEFLRFWAPDLWTQHFGGPTRSGPARPRMRFPVIREDDPRLDVELDPPRIEKFVFDTYEYARIRARKFVEWHKRKLRRSNLSREVVSRRPHPDDKHDTRPIYQQLKSLLYGVGAFASVPEPESALTMHKNRIRHLRAQQHIDAHWGVPENVKHCVRHMTAYRVRTGRLHKAAACEWCGRPEEFDSIGRSLLHAHHADYYDPDTVTWLCHSCHSTLHRKSFGWTA